MVSTEDLSYFQSLNEAEKMKLVSEITRNMYRAPSLFSLVATGRGYVLDVINPYKKKDTLKWKCKPIE